MLTVTSTKYTFPELTGNGLYRLVRKSNGESLYVEALRYFVAEEHKSLQFGKTMSKTQELGTDAK